MSKEIAEKMEKITKNLTVMSQYNLPTPLWTEISGQKTCLHNKIITQRSRFSPILHCNDQMQLTLRKEEDRTVYSKLITQFISNFCILHKAKQNFKGEAQANYNMSRYVHSPYKSIAQVCKLIMADMASATIHMQIKMRPIRIKSIV